jgi:hypothetical protein
MAMTYADLAKAISKMTPEQQNMNLTIHTIGEYYPAELMFSDNSAELDFDHPYFKIEGEQ